MVALLCTSFFLYAQASGKDRVFLIGENQSYYDKIVSTYESHLLEVCDESMDKAYNYWTSMMNDIEEYAADMDFDIRGVKLWVNVFWSKNGKVDHIVFYPKPNSKNTDYDRLNDILEKFASSYSLPLQYEQPFSHYGSASFPTFHKYQQAQVK